MGKLGKPASGSSVRLGAAASVVLLLVFCPGAPARAAHSYDYSSAVVNQENAQSYAAQANHNGTDDSKHEGVKNGTKALSCLGTLDLPCAFRYGYKGYGNYINYQKLDALHDDTKNRGGSMSSLGESSVSAAGAGSSGGGQARGKSPDRAPLWKNDDTAFLYQGEMNEVAARFEEASGMSRKALYKQIASAVDARLSWDDPKLFDKLEERYQAFVDALPESGFRSNVEKAHSLFSLAKKLDLLGEAREFYVSNRFGGNAPGGSSRVAGNRPGAPRAPVAASAASARHEAGVARSPAAVEGESAADLGRSAASEILPARPSRDGGMYLGLEGAHGAMLEDILPEDETIFHIVSRRYRKLTPALLAPSG